MKYTLPKFALAALFVLLFTFPAVAQEEVTKKKAPAEATRLEALIAPWVGESTVGVIHVDLKKLCLKEMYEETFALWKRFLKRTMTEENEILDFFRTAEGYVDSVEAEFAKIQAAGGGDVFILVDMKLGLGPQTPLVVIPVDAKKAAAVKAVMNIPKSANWLPEDVRAEFGKNVRVRQEGNYILAVLTPDDATETEIRDEILKNARKAIVAAERPELLAGLKVTAKMPVKAIFMPNDEIRQMVAAEMERMKEDAPEGFPLPSAKSLSRMIRMIAGGADFYKDKFSVHVMSADEKAAEEFLALTKKLQQFAVKEIQKEADDPIQGAFQADLVDTYYKIFSPKRDGAMLSWDKDVMMEEFGGEIPNLKAAAVSGFLAGLVLPAVQSARAVARRVVMQNKMKDVMLAIHSYEAVHGSFPPAYTVDKKGKPLHSWRVLILPFLEQGALYDKIRLDEPWDSEWNSQFHEACGVLFSNPAAGAEPGMATIAVVVGEETMFPPGGKTASLADCKDGLSNTLALVERACVCWMDPLGDVTFEDACEGINAGGENGMVTFGEDYQMPAAMCDGCVRQLSEYLSVETLKALLTKAGGERVSQDF